VLPSIGEQQPQRLRMAGREGYAAVGNQSLHYVEAGDGPLIVRLHGCPEFWFGWRLQIEPLVAAGFRVVAPDTRGYVRDHGFSPHLITRIQVGMRSHMDNRSEV
jgi:pimeloyl-ACP methyl ester carboxylesterase